MFRQDYIERQIEQLAQALARITALRTAGSFDAALEEVRQSYGALGVASSYLRLDAKSLTVLVRDKNKLLALARLLDEEALVLDALRNTTMSGQCRQRAQELRSACDLARL